MTVLLSPWADPCVTAKGEPRARVAFSGFSTLWFNTGTLCNIACPSCYIESTPRNDALVYLTANDAEPFLADLAAIDRDRRCEIGFTGGEPFMNPHILPLLERCLSDGWRVLVLTNAMQPMQRVSVASGLEALIGRYSQNLTLRVSLDAPEEEGHDAMREPGAFSSAVRGIGWLNSKGARLSIAGRLSAGENESGIRSRFAGLFQRLGLDLDAFDHDALVLFPEMDEAGTAPEITESCWSVVGATPERQMCANSRMVIRRRGEPQAHIVACTLLPYHKPADLGLTLQDGFKPVTLSHKFCAQFCVLGGARCSG